MATAPGGDPPQRPGRIKIDLPFEDAMRALLKVDPATVPAEPNGNGKPAKRSAKKAQPR